MVAADSFIQSPERVLLKSNLTLRIGVITSIVAHYGGTRLKADHSDRFICRVEPVGFDCHESPLLLHEGGPP